MIDATKANDLEKARDMTLRATQWLNVNQLRVRPSGPPFSWRITTYMATVDPAATDEERLVASRRMLKALEVHARQERWEYDSAQGSYRDRDPLVREWETTERDAVLETLDKLLRASTKSLETECRKKFIGKAVAVRHL
ncbi:hypothetical protein [Tranquillimonas alkanivorans]|uniref:Uncharacterized protein n=1 Tax=Tranquillimonas alkanivorans TaxID=441119 RepID=A0A1I5UCJ3_9RHOB|nr:hypothetical protein [Tranquillimonas alkanivorans]SFP92985.1 hypothetical protein SAMN04488047_11931 [Tranquillimonas alkanivorans]